MTNLTISLSDETLEKLRRTIKDRYADKKGALSGLIEESIREKLEAMEIPQQFETFRAMKNDRVIAEDENLDNLTEALEEAKVDPRSVRIVSSKRLTPLIRTGLRGRET